MLTGQARVDLTDVAPERMPNRLSSLVTMPAGARVSICVGALAVEPAAVRQLREQERRLQITIEGEPFNVPRWLEAVRGGFGELIL